MTAPDLFATGACQGCGRWITATNPQAGRSCYLCLADWLTDEPDYLEPRPVAYAHTGTSVCAGCGTDSLTDLCSKCDGTSPYRTVNA